MLLREEKFHFAFAFAIRVVFTLYGLYHDAYVSQVKSVGNSPDSVHVVPMYTDIDYQVFSDAALYVYQVNSHFCYLQ